MPIYTYRFQVNAPLEKVAEFHQDTRALKLLTPPPVYMQLHSTEPLGENSKADFTLWLGPVPVHWLAVHSQVDPLRGFTDTQARGPFEHWVHRHSFAPVDAATTEITDIIDAEPGNHPFWGPVSRFMWSNLPMLFTHRERVTRRVLEKSKR